MFYSVNLLSTGHNWFVGGILCFVLSTCSQLIITGSTTNLPKQHQMIASRTPEKQQYGGADPTETKSRGAYVIEQPATPNTHHNTPKIASRGSGGAPSEPQQASAGRALPPPPISSALLLQETNPKQVKLLENILQKHSLEQSPPASLQHQHSPQRRPQPISPSQQGAAVVVSGGDAKIEGHVDIKLQLLDTQLRHILKSSREDSLMSSSGSAKADQKGAPREAVKLQPKSSLSSMQQPQQSQDDRCVDKTRTMDLGIGEKGDGAVPNVTDGGEKYTVKQWERGSVGDMGKRVSIELKNGTGAGGDDDEDVLVVAIEPVDRKPQDGESSEEGSHAGVAVVRKPSIINLVSVYRGADDRSQTNHADDALTNVYMDDMATRAAPFTVVSQMNMSLGDSDDGAASDPEDRSCRTLNRAHSLTSISFSPFSEKRRGSHLMRQILDVSEKLGMKEFWKRRDIYNELNRSSSPDCSQCKDDKVSGALKLSDKDATGASAATASEHRPVLSVLSGMPKPKFSTKSPSSPAKLSSLSKQSQSPDTSRSLKPTGAAVAMTTVVPIETTVLSDSHAAGDSVVKDFTNGLKAPSSRERMKPVDVIDGSTVNKHIGEAADIKNIPGTEPVVSAAICGKSDLKSPVHQKKLIGSNVEERNNEIKPGADDADTSQKNVVFSLEERGMADGASPRLVDSEAADRPVSPPPDWNHSLKDPELIKDVDLTNDPDLTPTAPEMPLLIIAESVSRKTTPPYGTSVKHLATTKPTTKSSSSLLDIYETRNVDVKCNFGPNNETAKKNNFGALNNGTTENSEMNSEPPVKHVAPSADDKQEMDRCDDYGVAKLECDPQSKKELSRVLHDIFGSDSTPAKKTSSSFQKHIHVYNDSLSQPATPSGKFMSPNHDGHALCTQRQHAHSLGHGLVSFTEDLSQTRSADQPVSDDHMGGQGSRTPNTDTGRQPRPPPGHAPRSAMTSTAVR